MASNASKRKYPRTPNEPESLPQKKSRTKNIRNTIPKTTRRRGSASSPVRKLPFTLIDSETGSDSEVDNEVIADAMSQPQDKIMSISSAEMARLLDD